MCQQSLSVETVLQKMQSSLACTICLDLLITPMTTKCGHTFCKLCIERLLQGSKSSAPCPLCITTAITRRSAKQNKKIANLVLAVRNVISSIKKDCGIQEPIKKTLPLISVSLDGSEIKPCIRRGMRKRGETTSLKRELLPIKKIFKEKVAKARNDETGPTTEILSENYTNPSKAKNDNDSSIPITSSCSQSQKLKVEQWLTRNVSIQLVSDLSKVDNPHELIKETECNFELTQVSDIESKEDNEAIIQAHNTKNKELIDKADNDFTNQYLSQASTVLFKQTENTEIIPYQNAQLNDGLDEMENTKDEVSSEKENEKSMINNIGPKRGGIKRILTEPNSVGNSLKLPKTSQALFDKQEKIYTTPLKQAPRKTAGELVYFGNGKTPQKGTFPLKTLAGKTPRSEMIDSNQTNSKGYNTRFASEIKSKLPEFPKSSRLMTRSKTRKSPSWSRIAGARKDLGSKHTSLNITGGELKSTLQRKTELLGKKAESSQESSVIIVEDPSQVKSEIKTKSIRNVYSKVSSLKIQKKKDVMEKINEADPQNILKDKQSELTIYLSEVKDVSLKGQMNAEKNYKKENSYALQLEDKSSQYFDGSQPKTACGNVNISDKLITSQHKPNEENLTKSPQSTKKNQNECKSLMTNEKEQIKKKKNISPKPEQKRTKSPKESEGSQSIDHCMESNIYPSQDSTFLLREPGVDKVTHLQNSDNGQIPEHEVSLKPQEMAHLNSVPFVSKGNLSLCSARAKEIVNRSCHHFIPCELFQALVKYSSYLVSTNNMCHSTENCSHIPTTYPSYSTNGFQVKTNCTTPILQLRSEKAALSSYADDARQKEDDTLLIADLAQPSNLNISHDRNLQNHSLITKDSEHLANEQSLLANEPMKSENHPSGTCELSQNTSFSVSVLQDENEQISFDPDHVESNPTASLNMDHNSQGYQQKIKTEISKNTTGQSSLLVSYNSPIKFKPKKLPKILDDCTNIQSNSIASENSDLDSQSYQQKIQINLKRNKPSVPSADSSVIALPSCFDLSSHSPMNLKVSKTLKKLNSSKISTNKASLSNGDFDSTRQSSPPDLSTYSPITFKRNKKSLNILDSSDDEPEELVLRKRKRTTSPSCSKKTSHIDSDEMRDFERYDDNVWKYFEEKSMLEERCKTLREEKKETNEGKERQESDDDPIPGTAEEINSKESDLSILQIKQKKVRVLSDTESEHETQVGGLISQCSTASHFTDTTRNLFKNCNISLNLAQGVLNREEKSSKSKEFHPPYLPDAHVGSDEADVEDKDVGNDSRSSVFSSQSVVISTQQRNKVQDEVETLKKKILALEQEMMNKDVNLEKCNSTSTENATQSSQCDTALSEIRIKEVEIEEQRDSDLDSEELFRTYPCPPKLKSKGLSDSDVKKNDTLHISKVRPLRVICTGLSQSEVNQVQSFIEILGGSGARFLSRWSKDITHVIVKTDEDGTTERTLKYLFGVASGAWILSHRWITDSLASSLLLPEVKYEALDCTGSPGPYRGRHVVEPVFKGCQFNLLPPFEDVTLNQLSDLIQIAGGVIVKRFNENNPGLKLFVSNSEEPREDSVTSANVTKKSKVTVAHDWIIECIGMYSLVALSNYITGSPPSMEEILSSGIPESLIFETQDVLLEAA